MYLHSFIISASDEGEGSNLNAASLAAAGGQNAGIWNDPGGGRGVLQQRNICASLCLVDRASFVNTLFLFQLDTLFYFPYIFTIFFLQFSLHVSDRLVHHQENQTTRAASGTFPSFVAISCVAVGAN